MEKIGIEDKEKRLGIITDLETSGIMRNYRISEQSIQIVVENENPSERKINLITQFGEDLLKSINLE